MVGEFSIKHVLANKDVIDEVIGLGKTYYNEGSELLNGKYLSWLYLDNPNGQAKLVCSYANDLLVGVIALIPFNCYISGDLRSGYFASNVLTHPSYRGKNLFIKMIRYSQTILHDEQSFLAGHPNDSALPGWKRTKMNFGAPLFSCITLRKPGTKVVELSEEYSSMLDVLYDEIRYNQEKHLHLPSIDYLKWRYNDCPTKKYKVCLVIDKKTNKPLGLKVVRLIRGYPLITLGTICSPHNTKLVVSSSWLPTICIVEERFKSLFINDFVFKKKINCFLTCFSNEEKTNLQSLDILASDIF